jgi:glycosyltransferase involved in cell wall biosynthesis
MHDLHLDNLITEETITKFNKIIPVSHWHANYLKYYYKFLTDEHLWITSNGINLNFFQKEIVRNPHKAIYSSSPSRGLETLCHLWQDVRRFIPDAELHVYYGFDVWEISAKHNPQELIKIKYLKDLINNTPGVILHGRVAPETLAEAQLSSGVWTYPTQFLETSCITAMEAQAAGLRIVTSQLGALPETVKHGVLLKPENYHLNFVLETVKAMAASDQTDRKIAQEYAKSLSWDLDAHQWHEMFKQYGI